MPGPVRWRTPPRWRRRAKEDDRWRAKRRGQVCDPGVGADHAPGGGDDGGQLEEVGATCDDPLVIDAGGASNPESQLALGPGTGDDNVWAQRRGDAHPAIGWPAPRGVCGSRVNDGRAHCEVRRCVWRWIEIEIAGIRRNPVFAQEPAPTPDLVLGLPPPGESLRSGDLSVRKGDQAPGTRGQQQAMARGAAAVQVDRDIGLIALGWQWLQGSHVDD